MALRFKRWRTLFVLVGVLATIWFAPAIVALTPLKQTILNAIFADLKGSTRVGGASLGWLSPVVLDNVELRDAEGRALFIIPTLRSSASLLSLLTNRSDLGTFTFERPTVHIVWDDKQTNFEDTFASWLQGGSGSSSSATVRLHVRDGQLTLESATSKEKRTVDKIQFAMTIADELAFSFRGSEKDGEIDLGYGSKSSGGEMKLTSRQWPLAAFAPLLCRANSQLDGTLNGALVWQWDKEPTRLPVKLESTLVATNVRFSGAAIGQDQLRLDRLEFPCTLKAVGNDVAIERAEVICDVGKASLSGVLNVAATPFEQKNAHITADVDLARLANLLPGSLRLKKGTRLTSGRLTFDAHSQPRDGRAAWQGRVRTTDLQGVHNGQPISWQQPISADFDLYSDNGLPVVQRLKCDSSFLQIEASGSANQWSAKANYDLEQLVKELSRFVDFADLRVAGKGSCKFLNTLSNDRFTLNGEAQLFGLDLGSATSAHWQEPQFTLQLQAAGKVRKDHPLALDTANVTARAGGDEVTLTLSEPVSDASKGLGKATFRASGDLTRWRRRLMPFVPEIESILLTGQGELAGRFGRDASGLALNDLILKAQNLRVAGGALNINEPTLEVRSSVRWQAERIELHDLQVTSSTLGANFPKTIIQRKQKTIEVSTRGLVNGNASRLQSWFQPSASSTVVGEFTGEFDVQTQAEVVTMKADVKLKDFGFASSTWRDPQVRLACTTRVDATKDIIILDSFSVETPALATNASGKIVQWSSRKDLSLAGQVRYDLEKLEPHLRALLGPSVKVVGRDSRPFHLEGSLASAAGKPLAVAVGQAASQTSLTGEFGASWQSLSAFNCQLGPADVKALLAGSLVQFQPIDTSFNQGRFKAHPTLRLDPAELTLAKGWMVERVRLTPAVSSGALSYALPILAGVAEADGQLSVHLDSARIPLADSQKADVSGQIHIHNAQVGPSALVRELSALLIKGNQRFSIASNSVVPFQLVKGRVYHRDLEIVFPEVKVRTHGSVGLDGSLAILAEMPIPPKWLGSGRISAALAKQTIRVPMGGTLERPRLDEAALRNISAQVTRDLATDVLRQQVENNLNKLFNPKK